MINDGKISVREFFLLHPFSAIENRVYQSALKDVDFWKTFYTVSNKTYERLVSFEKVDVSGFRNTIVLTGYRGCGKTNFLKYCQNIIDGKIEVEDFAEARKIYFDNFNDDEITSEDLLDEPASENAKEKIEKEYTETLKKIATEIRSPKLKNQPSNIIERDIANYLTEALRGESVYINFDADRVDAVKPLQHKLVNIICVLLGELIESKHFESVLNFYNKTILSVKGTFEGISKLIIDDFFETLQQDAETTKEHKIPLFKCGNVAKIERTVRLILDEFEIDQLCFTFVLLKIFIKINGGNRNRLFIFLDNIDAIAKNGDASFVDTISRFWDFIHEMGSFVSKLSSAKDDFDYKQDFVTIYNNINYVIAMRETTAMHITDHVRERMKQISIHHDISKDYSIAVSMYKRCLFLDEWISKGEITNKNFIEVYQCISKIRKDIYFKSKISLLINNDYKRFVTCLCDVCSEHTEEVQKAFELIEMGHDYTKFGGRSYILRLILNSFKNSGYLTKLHVSNFYGRYDFHSEIGYSLCRVVILLLENLKSSVLKDDDYFFSRSDRLISYDTLMSFVKNLDTNEYNITDQIPQLLADMFSLRNEETWNHMITFDNIFDLNVKFLKKQLDAIRKDEPHDLVYLRATLAGKAYLQYFSIHFEYFACRFSKNSDPLFACDVTINDSYKTIINRVFKRVKRCCSVLKETYINSFNKYDDMDDDETEVEVVPKVFLLFDKKHEERIIHHHIAYLNAFRTFQIVKKCKPKSKELKELNNYMVIAFKNYLGLLYEYKDYYSKNSAILYKELSKCIDEIEADDYNINTRVTRDYYHQNIKK